VNKQLGPTLLDYIRIFPNLSSVHIDLVFQERVHSPRTSPFKDITTVEDPHRLPSVTFSFTRDIDRDTDFSREWWMERVFRIIAANLKGIGIEKLDNYHLDILADPTQLGTEGRVG
jgi:hypothetical protein